MTAIYEPSDEKYFDRQDLKEEILRVFDICHGCRLCYNLCPSFPTLFDFIDAKDGQVSRLEDREINEVVSECYECKLCYVKCPYIPPHEWQLDFPRLMLRAKTQRRYYKESPVSERFGDSVMSQVDLIGKAAVPFANLVNKVVLRPGTFPRKVMQTVTNTASSRLLPPYAKERFSTWWRKRGGCQVREPVAKVSLFSTCFVEYMNTKLGQGLVSLYEHNSIELTVPKGIKCCGAPLLHSGDVKKFIANAKENSLRLAIDVKMGKKIVVAQPTCGYVLKYDYPMYLKDETSKIVAQNTLDAAEYLVGFHKSNGLKLDLSGLPEKVAYHIPCHLKAQNIGYKSKELLSIFGIDVKVLEKCSGIDGTWGYKKQNYDLSKKVIKPLISQADSAIEQGYNILCGDCHLANYAIVEETGQQVLTPYELLAQGIQGKTR